MNQDTIYIIKQWMDDLADGYQREEHNRIIQAVVCKDEEVRIEMLTNAFTERSSE